MTKISFNIVYFLLILLGSLACTPERHTSKSEAKAMRRAFCEKHFQYFYPQSPATVNALANHYYGNKGLKAAVFGDYNAKPYDAYLMVNFGWPFEKNLPPDILAELKKRNLLNKKLVDVAWVVQPLSSMGGNTQDNVKNITHLMAHGWADPDAPMGFHGDRLKREFLYGLYDADSDISYEVKMNKLTPFEIHTHDSQYSPETAAVRFSTSAPDSMALWSLVIDNENPQGPKALATLHWLISDKDRAQFKQEIFDSNKQLLDSRGRPITSDYGVKFKDVGELISFLKNKSSLKNTSLVKKLTSLFNVEC
jgi:hypothetical protein